MNNRLKLLYAALLSINTNTMGVEGFEQSLNVMKQHHEKTCLNPTATYRNMTSLRDSMWGVKYEKHNRTLLIVTPKDNRVENSPSAVIEISNLPIDIVEACVALEKSVDSLRKGNSHNTNVKKASDYKNINKKIWSSISDFIQIYLEPQIKGIINTLESSHKIQYLENQRSPVNLTAFDGINKALNNMIDNISVYIPIPLAKMVKEAQDLDIENEYINLFLNSLPFETVSEMSLSEKKSFFIFSLLVDTIHNTHQLCRSAFNTSIQDVYYKHLTQKGSSNKYLQNLINCKDHLFKYTIDLNSRDIIEVAETYPDLFALFNVLLLTFNYVVPMNINIDGPTMEAIPTGKYDAIWSKISSLFREPNSHPQNNEERSQFLERVFQFTQCIKYQEKDKKITIPAGADILLGQMVSMLSMQRSTKSKIITAIPICNINRCIVTNNLQQDIKNQSKDGNSMPTAYSKPGKTHVSEFTQAEYARDLEKYNQLPWYKKPFTTEPKPVAKYEIKQETQVVSKGAKLTYETHNPQTASNGTENSLKGWLGIPGNSSTARHESIEGCKQISVKSSIHEVHIPPKTVVSEDVKRADMTELEEVTIADYSQGNLDFLNKVLPSLQRLQLGNIGKEDLQKIMALPLPYINSNLYTIKVGFEMGFHLLDKSYYEDITALTKNFLLPGAINSLSSNDNFNLSLMLPLFEDNRKATFQDIIQSTLKKHTRHFDHHEKNGVNKTLNINVSSSLETENKKFTKSTKHEFSENGVNCCIYWR